MRKIIPILLVLLACSPPAKQRTAEMRITVEDTAKSVEAITKSIEADGGYVSGANVWREGDQLRARLTLRVPSEKLTTTLASIRATAKRVENESIVTW